MVLVKKRVIKGIPALDVTMENLHDDELPIVIFIHGFESLKEINLHYAYMLAEKGFRIILPEALYHGERSKELKGAELRIRFWQIVTRTIDELKTIKDFYIQEHLGDPQRIGVAGTSMGGVVTLGALSRYDWIKAGVSLMGNPAYEKFARSQINEMREAGVRLPFTEDEVESIMAGLWKYDLTAHPENLAGRPLLFWHGALDPVVPIEGARNFYADIKDKYRDSPDKLKFIEDPEGVHKVSLEGLRATVEWFSHHL